MRVTAAIARVAGQPLDIVELELDEPRAGEVRVRMVATGVCHTDALVRDQVLPTPLPVVLGHEGAGVVEAVGEGVATVRPGDHVVLGFNSCGSCASCRSGHPAYCETFPAHNFGGARADGTTSLRDGGTAVSSHFFGQSSFATFANVSERSVVKVRDTAPLDILGPLGCGLTTGAGAVLNVLRPDAGSSIVVFGTGDAVSNRRLGFYGNFDGFLGAVNWAVDRERQLNVPARPIERFQLALSAAELQRLNYTLWFGLPGATLLLGLVVYWTRRA